MKKILPLIALPFLLNAQNTESLVDITIANGVTDTYVEPITGADVQTEPILWGQFKAVFHIAGFNPTVSYSRSYNGQPEGNDAKNMKNTSEQIIVKVPLEKIGLNGWYVNYSKYLFNTYLLVTQQDREVWLVDKTNTTAKTGSMSTSDPGLYQAAYGENGGLAVEQERYEIIVRTGKAFAGKDDAYIGIFYETLFKPWEDTTEHWVHDGNDITLVYSQTKFETAGITVGNYMEDKELEEGFNIQQFAFDFGVTSIHLTDNYDFDEKLGENQQTYKIGIKFKTAYKYPTKFLGERSSLIISAFVNYDYYYLDTDTDSDQDTSIDLSNDYLYGASISLNF